MPSVELEVLVLHHSSDRDIGETVADALDTNGCPARSLDVDDFETVPSAAVIVLVATANIDDAIHSRIVQLDAAIVAVTSGQLPRSRKLQQYPQVLRIDDGFDDSQALGIALVNRCMAAKLSQQGRRISELESAVLRLTDGSRAANSKLGVLERLVILPNFEVPRHEAVPTLDDLPSELEGRRVLVRLDIDMAGDIPDGRHHFKIVRAGRTVLELLERKATVLILASQGATAVEPYETAAVHGLGAQARWLAEEIGCDEFELLDSFNSTGAAPLQVYPNLVESCPEEVLLSQDGARRISQDRMEELCRSSVLVQSLKGTFDYFVQDDFRSAVFMLPTNVGLSGLAPSVAGRGIEADLKSLEAMLDACIAVGRGAATTRVCFAGSSRPSDLAIVERLLGTRLFDEVALGPLQALVLKAASGDDLPPSAWAELERRATENGVRLMSIVDGVGRRLSTELRDRIHLPEDYYVSGETHGACAIANDEIASLGAHDTILGIGPSTIDAFCQLASHADLTFHFGMLGRAHEPYRRCTVEVIRAYCEGRGQSYMAGDHILALAYEEHLEHLLDGQVTGASTTNHYITGGRLPGVATLIENAGRHHVS